MRGRYELVDDDDPYGPGADLVLSLFAMAILMVGLIGTGDAVQRGAGMAEPRAAIQPLPAPDPKDARLRAVEGEVAALNDIVKRQSALLRDRESVRIDLTDITAEDGPLFESCGGNALAQYACQLRPTPRLSATLVKGLRAKAADMRSVGTNQVVVEVRGLVTPFESPVSRQREGQLDLSVDRAAGIAHTLAARGLPYACIVPIGLGRTRSPSLARQIARGQEALDGLDKVQVNQATAKVLARLDDLRVIAYARRDDIDDVCPSDVLSRAIMKMSD